MEFVFSRQFSTNFGLVSTDKHNFTGSLCVSEHADIGSFLNMKSGNILMSSSATVDGVDISELSFSADLRLTDLENASSSFQGDINNLFITPPGMPDPNFKDSLVSGEPVRELHYSSGASLFYGWFVGNEYLVISTSKEGLQDALGRL